MSKVTKLAERAMDSDFTCKKEIIATAEFIKTGRKSITRVEAEKLFGEAADDLDLQFSRLDHNMKALCEAEIYVSKEAKLLMQRGKDLANQVGDAMARIDKVMVRDFETKLLQLERFVTAMQALDALKKSGSLDKISASFLKQG